MRWVCYHYPQLPLEVLQQPADQPCAIVEPQGNRRPLTYCNTAAQARGVRPGMGQQSALGLVPELTVLPRIPTAESAAFQTLACHAYGFGSPVVIDEARGAVWVEVGQSLGLYGGWKKLAVALTMPTPELPYTLRLGVAPTMAAAFLIARVSEKPRRPVVRLEDLPKALAPLPLAALPFNDNSLQILLGAGLRSIGEVLAIPSAALGQRIGASQLLALSQLLGRAPEVYAPWQPTQQFTRLWEFAEGIETTQALLFPLRIVIAELVAYLKLRDLAVQHFQLRLVDSRQRVVLHPIRLLSATRDPARLLLVLRERLDQLTLEDGVMAVTVEADRFEPSSAIQDDFFADTTLRVGERLTELQEKLQARLGVEAVQRLSVSPDRRPAHSANDGTRTAARTTAKAVPGRAHPERPPWLLANPQTVRPRRFLSPPERIELGWWDVEGTAIARDYAVVEDQYGRIGWAFRDAGQDGWQLHGLWQ